jgi:hypothetical protein
MILEITTIILSAVILFLVYFARIKSGNSKTFLFSEKFLQKADESIFEFVKFVFKLYSLLFQNVATFASKVPHKVIHSIHFISHKIAQKSSEWIDKVTHSGKK